MCIIISKDKGVKPLDKDNFERAWNHNSDGGGVVWREPTGEVKMQKGIMEKETFLALLDKINTEDRAFIAHFRIRSVGPVVPTNCHPFILDHVTFAHNGTITGLQALEGKTDSETFGLACLKDKTLDWIKENQLLIELALGHSKFAFMDNETGEIFILNKDLGKERDGCWFSNSSADKPAPVQTYNWPYYGNGKGNYNYNNKFSNIKGLATFGTKEYKHDFCTFDSTKKCWIRDYGKLPWDLYLFPTGKVVMNRRGLLQLSYDIQPDKNLKRQKFSKKDKIVNVLARAQQKLEQALASYRKNTFSTRTEREDAELHIGAHNLVLNAIRRLINAGYAVDEDSLGSFIVDNTKPRIPNNKDGMSLQFTIVQACAKILQQLDGIPREAIGVGGKYEILSDVDDTYPVNDNYLPM